GTVALAERGVIRRRAGLTAAFGFVLAAALFAGDLTMLHFGGHGLFPMAAPTGGTLLIVSWLVLALAAGWPRRGGGVPFYLLPLWEKVARMQSAPDEGSASAERPLTRLRFAKSPSPTGGEGKKPHFAPACQSARTRPTHPLARPRFMTDATQISPLDQA